MGDPKEIGEASKDSVSVEDFKSLESRIDILATLLQSLVDAKKDPPKPPPQEDLDTTLPGFVKALDKPAEEKSEDKDSGSSSKKGNGKGEHHMEPPPWYSPNPPIPHPHINNRGDPPS